MSPWPRGPTPLQRTIVITIMTHSLSFDFPNIGNLSFPDYQPIPVPTKNGYIIFVQAFLKQQNYGVNVIDGFNGFIKNILVNHPQYDLLKAEINYNKFIHHDGIILFKVKGT